MRDIDTALMLKMRCEGATLRAFADVYTIEDLAMLYADIQVECQKQLGFMAEQIKKEVVENAE